MRAAAISTHRFIEAAVRPIRDRLEPHQLGRIAGGHEGDLGGGVLVQARAHGDQRRGDHGGLLGGALHLVEDGVAQGSMGPVGIRIAGPGMIAPLWIKSSKEPTMGARSLPERSDQRYERKARSA